MVNFIERAIALEEEMKKKGYQNITLRDINVYFVVGQGTYDKLCDAAFRETSLLYEQQKMPQQGKEFQEACRISLEEMMDVADRLIKSGKRDAVIYLVKTDAKIKEDLKKKFGKK